MIDLGPHAVYIVSAYLGVAVAIAALIGFKLVESRLISARLRALEPAGADRSATRP
jgi:heme exporter protein CcmD